MQILQELLSGVEQIVFAPHGDERGRLTAIEGEEDIAFPIRRIYYISDVPAGAIRGRHAHMDLRQVLICVKGSCVIDLDNGVNCVSVRLSADGNGIYIHGLIWREMRDFSSDCVLMAIVDRKYDRKDYIFEYERFKRITAGVD